jgi:hypothetical protein
LPNHKITVDILIESVYIDNIRKEEHIMSRYNNNMFDNEVSDKNNMTRTWNFIGEEKQRNSVYVQALRNGTQREIREAREAWIDAYDFNRR